MQYIKAKFPNSTRSYTYRTEDSVKAGDTVVNDKGAKLTVTDESVDMKNIALLIFEMQKRTLQGRMADIH